MSTYDPDREIDLAEALAALTAAAPEPSKGKGNGKSAGEDTHAAGTDWESLIRGILTAKDYHNALVKMAAKLLASGMKGGAATNFMRALMAGSAGPRDDRWQARHDDIPRAVKTAEAKGWQQQAPAQHAEGVALEDFRAYMPQHSFIYMPSRELWPGSSVNARIGPVPLVDKNGQPVLNKKGEQETVSASAWLDRNRPVEQMTWAPGLPMLIRDRLIAHGGWINRKGVSCFNLYLPPTIELGNATEAGPWLDHVHKVFPNDAEHIILWLAHRVQHPGEKVNHALMLGGEQGIGKDSLLEPVKHAVGPWNFIEVTPLQMLGRFNGYIKAVVLRVNEARDLGEIDRFALYEHMKAPTAAPPDVLRVDEKNLKEHYVPNLCGVIITTNYKTDGIYLPPDDRRHYVAWSDLKKSDFDNAYWNNLWHWFSDGGIAHVAAYLAELDLSSFDAKAPPPKTPAFWAIVSASQPPEDAEMADVLDHMGNPDATTIPAIAAATAAGGFYEWLTDRKNRRAIPYRLEKCGYEQVRNNATKDGLWVVKGSRQVIYAKMALSSQDKYAAAVELAKQ